jgi:hypothetical protein
MPLNHESKTEDFLFFVFQSVSQVATPLLATNNFLRCVYNVVTGCFTGEAKPKKAHIINNQEFNSNISVILFQYYE